MQAETAVDSAQPAANVTADAVTRAADSAVDSAADSAANSASADMVHAAEAVPGSEAAELAAPLPDLAPLAWVIDEIRTSLAEAINSAKTFLGHKDDTDCLRTATEHVHQVSGALQLLNLRGVGLLTEAVEQLFGQWETQPEMCMPAAVRAVDAALCSVRNYLDALLAGRPTPPIRLFPYYREILVLLDAPRVHPADLIFPDLSRRPAFHQMGVRSLNADELRIRRVHYEEGLLRFLRDPEDAQARSRMRHAILDLEGVPQRGLARSFWWVARALFDALDSFQLPVDADLKRFLARLNQQLRRQIEGGPAVAERLMVDALYHVGRADDRIERVAQAKQLYGLTALMPPDFDRATLTTIDTEALAALKESLSQCKLLWGQLVAGAAADATRFREELRRAQASALRLGAPAPARVLGCIDEVTARLDGASPEIREALGMEVATALMLLETGADGAPQSDPQFELRADALIERIMRAGGGMPLPEADAWVGELARQAQERSSLDTVVTEMRTTLREAELRLDRFFRNPAQREELAELPAMFEQVGGVLGVLGFEEPAAALHNVRDAVVRFADPATPADGAEFGRIAQNLGAVGFFVAELSQQPAQPRGVFRFDRHTGVFSADMAVPSEAAADADADADADGFADEAAAAQGAAARGPGNVEHSIERGLAAARAAADALAAAPADAAAHATLAALLGQLASDAELTDDAALRARVAEAARLLDRLQRSADGADAQALQALLRPAEVEIPEPTAPMPASASAADRELHEIFIEEADEVLESVGAQLQRLRREPADGATITMARRAFHTLKGSSRMVGLRDFGEFAWALEQCFNVWLAQERAADANLLDLATASADRMRDWIEALRSDPTAQVDASALIHAAHVVRDGGRFELPFPLEKEDIVDPQARTIEVAAAPAPADDGAGDGVDEYEHEYEGEHEGERDIAATTEAKTEAAGAPPATGAAADDADDAALFQPAEEMRRIGPLQISHGLYSVFLNESDECIRALAQDVAEWRYEAGRPVSAAIVRRAHTLAGISDTVGLAPVSALADPIDALMHQLYERGSTPAAPLTPPQFDLLERAIERARGMLHQFAAGIYPNEAPLEVGALTDLLAELRAQDWIAQAHELAPAMLAPELVAPELVAPEIPEPAEAELPEPAAPAVPSTSEPIATAAPAQAAATAEPAFEAIAVPAREPIAVPAPDVPAGPGFKAASSPIEVPAIRDDIDEQLFQVFTVEAQDLFPAVARSLRSLAQNPAQRDVARDLMRHLHTLKGSARMAGAMRLGELVHDMETRIEAAMPLGAIPASVVDELQSEHDHAINVFEALQGGAADAAPPAATAVAAAVPVPLSPSPAPSPLPSPSTSSSPLPAPAPATPLAARAGPASHSFAATALRSGDSQDARAPAPADEPARGGAAAPFIRVRADVVDRLVDQAGEVSIARSKLEAEVGTLRASLSDLTENIQRLRSQLREVELQADAQIQARSDQVAKQSSTFDPLEFDRYSRLQELTRLLAESVEDVALVQSNMLKGLQLADNDLSAQSRLTRELQQQLMRVRLVPFSNVAERLYRVARQAAKELDKRAHLDILGGETEIDRSLLEQMAGPFEHLVRNAIVHGLESPQARSSAGKSETGELRIEARKEGNEIVVTFSDDGAGLDLDRIRERAVSAGIVPADRRLDEREAIELIFSPGLSTAQEVTELAGRGVGMDVVREQVSALGGRISITTDRGKGTRFTLYLPMTLSIMQVVLASIGGRRYALPAAMVEDVRRVRARELALDLQGGSTYFGEALGDITLRPLAQLLGIETLIDPGEQYSVALLRLGDDRLAICADELSSNQEVVVKSVGPQVARLAGILGATVLGNGQVVLIINPVQLIGRAPEPPRLDPARSGAAAVRASKDAAVTTVGAATIMVVDDSLTVRRVTQRLLERNGYRTILAKDGVDAMRELRDVVPDIMLVDIEMPRMDGYDLTRNVRGASATRKVPIIMITSRTAEKHRRVAFELGVNEYLGKPYREDELLGLIERYLSGARAERAADSAGADA
jgi:chemosensory pili system protein ChpA (sensor histidine kinase/response regulator)